MPKSAPSLQYPIFGSEIRCPHCRQIIPALILTDTYLCTRHGAFEVRYGTEDLVHLQSERHWRLWEEEWYRQHTHPDGLRLELHEALDKLYTQGYRAVKVMIAHRYTTLVSSYLDHNPNDKSMLRLYGLMVEFSPPAEPYSRWDVINFELTKEIGAPVRYPYFRQF